MQDEKKEQQIKERCEPQKHSQMHFREEIKKMDLTYQPEMHRQGVPAGGPELR